MIPDGVEAALGRLQDFLSVHGARPEEEGVASMIAFGEYAGLDHDDQLRILEMIEDSGLDPLDPTSAGVYLGVLVGLIVLEEARTSVSGS